MLIKKINRPNVSKLEFLRNKLDIQDLGWEIEESFGNSIIISKSGISDFLSRDPVSLVDLVEIVFEEEHVEIHAKFKGGYIVVLLTLMVSGLIFKIGVLGLLFACLIVGIFFLVIRFSIVSDIKEALKRCV